MRHRHGNRTIGTVPAPGLPDYLIRVLPGRETLSCDYEGCFEPDYRDLMDGTSDEMRPMYINTRHDVLICARCVAAGRHLDTEDTPCTR